MSRLINTNKKDRTHPILVIDGPSAGSQSPTSGATFLKTEGETDSMLELN